MKALGLNSEIKRVLLQLIDTLNKLNIDDYTFKLPILSSSSIGEHTRHIIELFQCLNKGYNVGIVNYDDRKRDLQLQNNLDFAMQTIAQLVSELNREDKILTLISTYDDSTLEISSTYNRELLYNLEHCIHHQAIIKIGLEKLNIEVLDDSFGVAKSTLEYRKSCVQ